MDMPGSSAHEILQGGYWNGLAFPAPGRKSGHADTRDAYTQRNRHAADTARGLPSAKQRKPQEKPHLPTSLLDSVLLELINEKINFII